MFQHTSLGASTRTQYETKLTQWELYTNTPLPTLAANPNESLAKLHAAPIAQTPTNRHVYLSAMIAYITHVAEDKSTLPVWKELQKENSEPLSEHYASNEPTANQKNKQMDWDVIHQIREELPRGMERLLLTLYICMEPIRADYYATEIVQPGEESKEENYIVMSDPPQLVIRDFKTKKKYEKLENTLPQVVADELRASLEETPRKYVFVGENKTPYTRKLFSNWACRALTRVLKQPMTLTVLRHLYISQKVKEETPLQEMKVVAKKMGHSREMQRGYDWSK